MAYGESAVTDTLSASIGDEVVRTPPAVVTLDRTDPTVAELVSVVLARLDVGRQPPHEILGVAKDADEEVVKAAARQLKKKYHPDGAEPDQERFQAVVRAEEDLLDRA
jgi:hypothetical protein